MPERLRNQVGRLLRETKREMIISLTQARVKAVKMRNAMFWTYFKDRPNRTCSINKYSALVLGID
jgi:hypothetical protein